MRTTVLILTKVPGVLPVKTRLVPRLGEEGARHAYAEMLAATVSLARRFDPRPTLAYSPPHADVHSAFSTLGVLRLIPMKGADGTACLEEAFAAADEGAPLLALGGDAPDLPVQRLGEARDTLEDCDAVCIPTGDGGFSCLGLRRPVPGLAEAFRYGGADAFERVASFLRARGLQLAVLEAWPDIDTPEQYDAWRRRHAVAATSPFTASQPRQESP